MVKNMNDKYIFETDTVKEMELAVDRHKLVSTLYELENGEEICTKVMIIIYNIYETGKYIISGKI